MKTLQIELTPMEPYFLGNERGLAYGDTKTQQSLTYPYFIKSSKLPTQTALLGVLRYLGIENPSADFKLHDGDIANIGKGSFQLTKSDQTFGRIKEISPLVLMDKKDNIYVRKPCNLGADGAPFRDFAEVSTPAGNRLLPLDYEEKEYGSSGFYDLTNGAVISEDEVFEPQVRVGINRKERDAESESESKGFFKKEYVLLNKKYRFMFQATVDDDFQCYEKTVFMGQGHTAFSVKVTEAVEVPWSGLDAALPAIDGKIESYLYLKSDLYYSGEMKTLRKLCAYSITDSSDHRSLITNYDAGNVKARYKKQEILHKLICAGSVFLFRDEQQKDAFKAELAKSECFQHGKAAGFNNYYESGESKR